MPHDANGKLLQKGDRVKVEFEVVEVYPGADMCNVQLRNVVARKDGVQDGWTTTANTLEKKD